MPDQFVVFSCAHLLVDGYDFSADFTDLKVNLGSESLDATTFGSSTRKHAGALKIGSIEGSGYVNLGSSLSDPILFAQVGTDDVLMTAFLDGITVGTTAGSFGMGAVRVKYDHGGQVGALLPFAISGEARTDLVQAVAADNALSSAWSTATNNGSAINVAFESTTDKLYGGFHVTALSTGNNGVSVSAVIAAASSSGFTTSNNRMSFSAQTCKAGTFATPIASASLSTDQPFLRSVVTVATGTSSGGTANGLIWFGLQTP